ncbi:39S ribosomal protein L53, mitochondrial-like [Patiria miniata]|uniref:Large ribosomal subunit protein mL53 n=1 Tax=Patiria miniata TaxID=46514 RepID=A0A913ZIR3_PATMI|nr:39S ribosomal protein L53, mitochondrial-like [Patiria miniata]
MPAVIKNVHLKFVKNILVEFCPWQANVESARQFQSRIANFATRQTNMKCAIKTKVKNDGTLPSITILFDDGKQLIFKSSYLTSTEMLQRFGTLNLQREKALEQSDAGR